MEPEMNDDVRDEDMPSHIHKHMGKHMNRFGRGMHSWATWNSPVGLGFFLLTASLAAAIIIYTLLSLVSGIVSLTHTSTSPSYSYPAESGAYDDGSMQMPAGSATGAGTTVTP